MTSKQLLSTTGRTLGSLALGPFWLLGRAHRAALSTIGLIGDAFRDGSGDEKATSNISIGFALLVVWSVILTLRVF